jgi:hypothetical protein
MAEDHRDELRPAGKALGATVATVTNDDFLKLATGKCASN